MQHARFMVLAVGKLTLQTARPGTFSRALQIAQT
jgi:hypothetical protein